MKTVTARHENRDENSNVARETVTEIVTSLFYHTLHAGACHAA